MGTHVHMALLEALASRDAEQVLALAIYSFTLACSRRVCVCDGVGGVVLCRCVYVCVTC